MQSRNISSLILYFNSACMTIMPLYDTQSVLMIVIKHSVQKSTRLHDVSLTIIFMILYSAVEQVCGLTLIIVWKLGGRQDVTINMHHHL